MKRSWNGWIWAGLLVTLAAIFTYVPLFVPYPITRDVPWVNLLLFAVGGGLLAAGLKRAYTHPERYRGKVSGAIISVLAVASFLLFCWGNFVFARHIPAAGGAPRAGQKAPDFTLADAGGKPVSLSEMLKTNRAVVLIFYRGYW